MKTRGENHLYSGRSFYIWVRGSSHEKSVFDVLNPHLRGVGSVLAWLTLNWQPNRNNRVND